MPALEVLATDLAFGVLLGCVFAVIAHGLNLIWGVAKIVNVAHGVFIMLGAYGAYFLNLHLGALYVAIASVAIIALTHIFLSRTYLGNAIRAYSQDIPATQLMGINPTFVAAVGTALGFSVTMAGGALLSVWLPVGINPGMGALYAPISFVVVVLGGPGEMWGGLVGGVSLAVIIDVGQAFVGTSLATAIAFLTLIPILLFRPEGILRGRFRSCRRPAPRSG